MANASKKPGFLPSNSRRSKSQPSGAFVDEKTLEKLRRLNKTHQTALQTDTYPISPLNRPNVKLKKPTRFDSARLLQLMENTKNEDPAQSPTTEDINETEETNSEGPSEGKQSPQNGPQNARAAKAHILRQQALKRLQATAKNIFSKTAARALLANPYVLAGIGIALAVAGVIIFLLLILAGASGTDVASAGTSATIPFNQSAESTDLSQLKAALSGTNTARARAEKILQEIDRLKTQLADNTAALALLSDIESAANAIIAAQPDDAETIKAETAVIKKKIIDLSALIGSGGVAGSCSGVTPCLDVEPVTQFSGGHCGRASAIMALIYVNKGQAPSYFPQERYTVVENGVIKDKPNAQSCMNHALMNQLSPPERRGWIHWSYAQLEDLPDKEAKKEILSATQRSLQNNDPVILYVNPGGTYAGQHIVLIIGYDANNEPEKGGTYLINNPNTVKTVEKTKYGRSGNRNKLTGDHLIEFMSGKISNGDVYRYSVIIRKAYIK